MHQSHRNFVAMLAVLAASASAFAGCGTTSKASAASDAQPAAGTTLKVSADEMRFTPASYTAKAGKVKFDFTNDGQMEHEMVVLTADAASLKPGSNGKVSEKTSVGEVSETKPGEHGSVVLDLKAGTYLLVCNIPGHYAAGMQAKLVVS
jgi:uncharacterized cupredoxin-like copper-binding protein